MSSLSALSASVTRILSLTGFPKELKTKDIQTAFSEWETAAGGFKIKWVDDTSLYIVFQDATVAKRAYLKTVAYPPAIFTSPTTQISATIRPYDGPDAQTVIHAVNARHNNNNSRGQRAQSMSIPSTHGRGMSVSNGFRNGGSNGSGTGAAGQNGDAPSLMSISTSHTSSFGREPSPTLPNIPSHPTLNSLIENSLTGNNTALDGGDPAILSQGPRIGDPGKRMLGHALGVRHPGLPSRTDMGGLQKSMGGLAVADA